MKKYELTEETNEQGLHRIRALRDIQRYGVKKGDLGGFVERENNLSQEDDCWIADNATVKDFAGVHDDALVQNNATVKDFATIIGNSIIMGNATIMEISTVMGNARVQGNAEIGGSAVIC